MCSIEALAKRIAKGGNLPRINTAVDLGNAISLKYVLPIGAHDVQASTDDFDIRFARKDDTFIPFGENSPQAVDTGELVYARGTSVKTRRWIWRQSGAGMITEKTTDVFYPIDGFTGINDSAVRSARDEIADILARKLNCSISTGWVDADVQEFDFA